jgi:hypothetical protein
MTQYKIVPGGTTYLKRKSRKINDLRDFVFQKVTPACVAFLE